MVHSTTKNDLHKHRITVLTSETSSAVLYLTIYQSTIINFILTDLRPYKNGPDLRYDLTACIFIHTVFRCRIKQRR